MARFRGLLAFLVFGSILAGLGRAADYTYYLTGSAADVRPTHTEAGLLLMGGGGDVDEAFSWFVEKSAGGDLVVLRASGADGYHDYLFNKIGGIDSVETLLFHNRAAAEDPRVLEIIRHAEGIWLAGGDQSRYVNYWKGTSVAAALNAHVRAGKPLGGTSAGLAVLGEFSFSATETGTLTSELALRDPYDPRITLERDFLHLELLRGIITDSHFMARGRLGRSLVFLARLLNEEKRDRLVGLGIDEKTALAINADGTAQVFTTAREGRAWLMIPTKPAEVLAAKRPLTLRDVRLIALGPTSRFDVKQLRIQKPAAAAVIAVVDGKLSPLP